LRLLTTLVLLLAAASNAHASSVFRTNPQFPAAAAEEEGTWAGQLALGYGANSGNTNNSHVNGRFLLGHLSGPWRHAINALGTRTKDSGNITAERYVLNGKTDYRFGEQSYLFITAQYEEDRFAGFDRRISEALGYGRHLYEGGRHRVAGEIGIGARQVRLIDGTRDNEAIGRLGFNWLFQVSETTEVTSRLVVESGSDNTFTESISTLKTNLVGPVYAALAYTVKRNSRVPAGRERQDTHTSIQIEIRF